MSTKIEILKKYLSDSEKYMSAYGKHHLLKGDYLNIEEGMNSGHFVKINRYIKFKYYLSLIPQFLLFYKEIIFNPYMKKYKKICDKQSRWFNLNLIIHSIVLRILSEHKILNGNVCTIGDGKANFVNGILDKKNIKKIFSVNLPQALIQDYLVLRKFNSIDDNLIKVVEREEDIFDKTCKLFLIPVQNKRFLNNKDINLFVNISSFQEMPISETHKYIDIAISNNAYLYSLNNQEKIMYDKTKINYNDYGFKEKGNIIFEDEAKFSKYYYNSSFPFIHKKKGKVISALAKF